MSVNSSITFRENLAPELTTIALTYSTLLKALNSDLSVNGLISISSIPYLVSGLSEPYLSIASLYVILGNVSGRSMFFTDLKICLVKFSMFEKIVSSQTKDISISI